MVRELGWAAVKKRNDRPSTWLDAPTIPEYV